MSRSHLPSRLALLLSWTLAGGLALAQTPVPSTVIHIHGTQDGDDGQTVSYRAFTNPGDPYRIICSEPCAADLPALYGLYAGFGLAYQQVTTLFGGPALPSSQPFDLHIDSDHWCGPEQPGIGGDSQTYAGFTWSGLTSGSWGCFWFTTPGHYSIPFHYPETSTLAYQLLTAHEFTHTEFFDRHWYSYEDFAKAVSLYVTGVDGAPPITDPCDDALNRPADGRFLWLLCHDSGFQWSNLAPAFQALNATFQAGEGAAYQGITSMFQFRQDLNAQVPDNTLDAFFAAKVGFPGQVGGNGTLRLAGGRAGTLGGWSSFLAPVNAVNSDTNIHVDGAYFEPTAPPGLFSFANAYRITKANGKDFHFDFPVYWTLKYDPSYLDHGTDESTLAIYIYNGVSFQAVANSKVDPLRMTVSAPITGTGQYVVSASSTLVTPTEILPRVLAGSSVHTRAVLRNAGFDSISGTLQFHPQGAPASPSDPTLAYSLAYAKTLVLADVAAAFGQTGPGSVDVVSTFGALPDVLALEVDASGSGYPGSIVPAVPAAAALRAGDQAFLVAPGNASQEGFRFLVRTFASGVTFTVVARDVSGAVIATTPLTYTANQTFLVVPKDFAGGQPWVANESYEIDVQSGSAVILSQTAENGQSSHNYRVAERADLSATTAGDTLNFPKAAAATNPDGSTLRTALQLTNPSGSTITGRVRFKPSDGTPAVFLNYSIPAFAGKAYSDIVGGLGKTGTGALQVTSTAGVLPVALARLIHSGNSTSFQLAAEGSHGPMEVLQAGDRTLLQAPPDTSGSFQIGVRTLSKGIAMTITVNTADGFQLAQITKSVAPKTVVETSASTFLGMTLTGGEIIEIFVDGGGGLIYGTTANPSSGALNYQAARRLPYV